MVLGSASPRRSDLLRQLGVEFEVVAPEIDETPVEGESPVRYVRRLAIAKSAAVTAPDDALVLTADTTVDLDGRILGKPVDRDDAAAMLRSLSARTHRVHTGVAARVGDRVVSDVVTSLVTFTPLTAASIDWYLDTGEYTDKAGGYAVQGAAGVFVQRIRGSVSNIVGLPLHTVARLASELGVPLVGAD